MISGQPPIAATRTRASASATDDIIGAANFGNSDRATQARAAAPTTAPIRSAPLLIRPSTPADLPAITAIYADAVVHGTGSFELDTPDQAEMQRRRADVLAKGLPWLVAQAPSVRPDDDGRDASIVGYAYATPFRPRPAYRHTLENSVYCRADARSRGVGRLLMAELIARAEALGTRQMVAVIGDSANTASIALHRTLGFTHVGTLGDVGRKFDRWLDVVLMQRTLGNGARTAPP